MNYQQNRNNNSSSDYNNRDEDIFTQTTNPYAEEQKERQRQIEKGREARAAKARQYELPDPSKKKVISQDTPIRVNPTGQYNLNFIDWNNEWEAVMDRDQTSFESPIQGMSSETFEAIFDEEMFDTMK